VSFGDGVFETIRLQEGQPLFWAAHRARLTQAMETLALQLPCPWESIEAQLYALSARLRYGRLKLLIIRAGEGAYTPLTQETLVWLIAQPLPKNPSYPLSSAQNLILYPHPLLVETPWSRFKTLSAIPYVQAAYYASQKGHSDALLLSQEGYVAETSRANLFWFDGKTLHTPPLSTGAVAGILRAQIITLATSLHIPTQETLTHPESLAHAQEVFTTNVIQGLAPVKQLTLPHHTINYPAPTLLPRIATHLRQALTLTPKADKSAPPAYNP
jgi:branched-subunit amino acid aminotransferase/4-amino-4-deoxychorismate lyase